MTKVSRASIKDKLKDTKSISSALMIKRGSLTHKQLKFAQGIAIDGLTGAEAYRQAYQSKAKPHTVANNASAMITKHKGIQAIITAMEAAKEAERYNTAESLRSLVINSLVQTLIDPSTKASDRTNCAKVLGQVTEVAAFTTRSETTVIKDSGELRLQILDELRSMMLSSNQSITDIDTDSLMAELIVGKDDELSAGELAECGKLVPETALKEGGSGDEPLFDVDEVAGSLHIIPDKQSFPPENSLDSPLPDSDRIQKRAPYVK
jgi:hypothetical protein